MLLLYDTYVLYCYACNVHNEVGASTKHMRFCLMVRAPLLQYGVDKAFFNAKSLGFCMGTRGVVSYVISDPRANN